ncbi:RNA methyltransferase, TrmH family, group 1 [[Leptolyngbya] sp. PCC 7376]|uniref:RNA methyltransferase n=1 Tax=[Leptolyngbya] sp. PCC 7376 TaxID=111781 RepID=UPI00029F0ADD|nr:RNA methyltransferase [[Leptolyngbya] sp. PCC 7376]AFY40504.1 RNA methyltransferase, TrmH family, group 1 [[Leptolyngbya] sp. PCC 7376]
MSSFDHIRIVIVEPAGALNVGSVARVMKNMGLSQLILVNPRCDHLGKEARLMAVKAPEILEHATVMDSLADALQGCHKAIATTGQPRELSTPMETPKQVLPWVLEDDTPSAIIFGREDNGLTNTELNHAQRFLCIPTGSEYTSLNLAQAIAVCCYELQSLSTMVQPVAESPTQDLADLKDLEGYYQHLEQLLLKIGYLQPHTAAARMNKFRSLYNRNQLTQAETSMLRGILRQTAWAIANPDKLQSEQPDE